MAVERVEMVEVRRAREAVRVSTEVWSWVVVEEEEEVGVDIVVVVGGLVRWGKCGAGMVWIRIPDDWAGK